MEGVSFFLRRYDRIPLYLPLICTLLYSVPDIGIVSDIPLGQVHTVEQTKYINQIQE